MRDIKVAREYLKESSVPKMTNVIEKKNRRVPNQNAWYPSTKHTNLLAAMRMSIVLYPMEGVITRMKMTFYMEHVM